MDNVIESQVLSLVDGFIDTMIELKNSDPGEEQALYESAEEQLLALADKALLLLGGQEEYLEAMLNQLISQKLPHGAVMNSFGNFKQELDEVVSRSMDVYREKKGSGENVSFRENDFAGNADEVNVVEEPDVNIQEAEKPEGEILSEVDMVSEGEPVTNGSEVEEEAALEESGEQGSVNDIPVEGSDDSAEEECSVKDELGFLVNMVFPGEEVIPGMEFSDMVFDFFIPKYSLAFFDVRDGEVSLSNLGELALTRAGISVICLDPSKVYNIKAFKRDIRRFMSQKDSEEKRVFEFYAE